MFLNIDKIDRTRIAALDERGTQLSYGDLCIFSSSFSSQVGDRCLVFILCDNSIGSLAGYAACMSGRIVPLLLSSDLDDDLLCRLIDAYHPTYLWAPENMVSRFEYQTVERNYGQVLLKTGLSPYPLYDDLSLLLTTSGSTGSPKLVRHSYENVESNAKSIAEYLKLDETERPITNLPMNYTYGLSIIHSHLLVGATLLVTARSVMQKEFWNFFREQKATSFAGVPYTFEMLKRLRFFRMNLPSLRYVTQAGGKLTPELHRDFAEWAYNSGKQFIIMYGQTEASPRMGYLPPEKNFEKCGSMGISIPGGKLSLIDLEGKEITTPDVTGELVYYGPNVTLGYAQAGEDLIKGDERHGRLETGDMAKVDAEGYFYIVGRKKRFLKIFGNRVNLDECERMIKTTFDCDCACVGVDDRMTIYIASTVPEEQVLKFISEKTGLHFSAFNIRLIDAIPKSDSGKTQYSELTS